jgi:hypothetical protein
MASHVLIKNAKKYAGKYVAKKSFNSQTVIDSGEDPILVYETAKKKGAPDPVVFFIPRKNEVQIY